MAFINEMHIQGIKPNSFVIATSALPGCAHLLALECGKQIHNHVIRIGFQPDVVVGTLLVDMHSKRGNVNIAHKLFERIPEGNVVS